MQHMAAAFRRGLIASQHVAWQQQQLAGLATSAIPEWASSLPSAWQDAAKPGSSYRRKMKIHFNVCDYDKDGVVRWGDIKQIVDNYAKIRNLKPGSAELRKCQDGHEFVFTKFWSDTGDLKGTSTEEKLVRNIITAAANAPWKNVEEFVTMTPVKICFDMVDADGDGFITAKEFKEFWDAHQLKPAEMKQVYNELDGDKDGTISRQEYYEAFYNWLNTPHCDAGHKATPNIWGIVPPK
ncbi:hypothetical protein HXX76_002622 [Chlamydomonas incerta]|uniref:EF-hand domain-containing protein n=1 Tax=Chlamydomonas incerta TaxID=51695 RepID=A0A835TP03_CHLIN|nr:hypothetical protein HXX76_002622 [Chlamydomonas incerta]|eukprot:KAG2442536.1 hypothetical protein HXX76_002622 [Chlamydomonas incerta]